MNVQLDSRATGSGKIATIIYDRQSKLNSLKYVVVLIQQVKIY